MSVISSAAGGEVRQSLAHANRRIMQGPHIERIAVRQVTSG